MSQITTIEMRQLIIQRKVNNQYNISLKETNEKKYCIINYIIHKTKCILYFRRIKLNYTGCGERVEKML